MASADVESIPVESVPATPAGPRRDFEVDKLFRMVMKHEGSDLHLKAGLAPMMRLRGIIRKMDMRPLQQEDMERLLYPVLSPRQRKILDDTGGVDFAHIIGNDECRFRVNLFKQRGKFAADLGQPSVLQGDLVERF